jgi:hypothetical protein
MPYFQVFTTDGDALGVMELLPEVWRAGDVIIRGPRKQLRVVQWIPFRGDPERFDILRVERVAPADG